MRDIALTNEYATVTKVTMQAGIYLLAREAQPAMKYLLAQREKQDNPYRGESLEFRRYRRDRALCCCAVHAFT